MPARAYRPAKGEERACNLAYTGRNSEMLKINPYVPPCLGWVDNPMPGPSRGLFLVTTSISPSLLRVAYPLPAFGRLMMSETTTRRMVRYEVIALSNTVEPSSDGLV